MYDFELTKFLVECSTTEGEPSANNFPVDVRRVSGINLKLIKFNLPEMLQAPREIK